jgi:hypothetical protein
VGAAAAALDPEDVEQPITRLRRRIAGPTRTRWGRALRGVGALLLGVLVVLSPMLALELAAIVAGAFLIFYGASELLAMIQPASAAAPEGKRSRRRAFAVAATAGGLCVAVLVALVLVFTADDGEQGALASTVPTRSGACNGAVALCELRLNEAVFAGTHNSFSAADSAGWYIANQRRTIKRQLRDGIRLFLIDAHWGVEDAQGKVRTDFASEGRSRNRVAKALPPNVLKAAERLVGRLGAGDGAGDPELWLCHTVCEIGATKMVDSLTEIREFLEANRGEVVILFIEPYAPPADIAKVFESAGLDRYLAELERDEPLPTLGSLVRRNKRVVVLSEKDADGTVPWYLDGFTFVQDTPLGAKKTAELSCRRERGDADSPFLMLNHWADYFPPKLSANRPFQTRRFLLERAHRCARERGLPVSLIAVDGYDQGEFLPAVDELNGERVRALRRRQLAGG